MIERAVVTSNESTLRLATHLSPRGRGVPSVDGYRGTLEEVERHYINQVLEHAGWRIEGKGGAAELLGLHPNTLRFRLRKLGIERPQAQKLS